MERVGVAHRRARLHRPSFMTSCSEMALDSGEPLRGTASVGQRYVLISRPKLQWGENALENPELAPVAGWAKRFDATHAGKTVVRLFAAPFSAKGVEVRLFPAGLRVRDVLLAELPTRLDSLFEEIYAGRTPGDSERCPRTLAVCTHGKHDRCCAEHGQATFRALSAYGDQLGVEVVESTHLGGHRFASTLLDLAIQSPGRMYGRLRSEDIPELVRHLGADRVWLERYRGRVDLGAKEQVVEAEALAAGAAGPLSIERLEDNRFVGRWTGGHVEVEVGEQSFRGLKSCGEDEEVWTRAVRMSTL